MKNLYRKLPGLPRRVELELLDFPTFQLDYELVSYNVIVSTLEERVCDVFLKSARMLEAMKESRNDKTVLEMRLLRRLEKLKKAFDDIYSLQKKVASYQSEIASLRAQIYQKCVEKLELKHRIRMLEKDLECREHDVQELRANIKRQCDRYNELWKTHSDLLMEGQLFRSQVPIRSSGDRVEGVTGWSGDMSGRTGGVSGA